MKIEVQTTTLGQLSKQHDDVLKIICESDEELRMFTKPSTMLQLQGQNYSFKNHQSYGNKNGEERIVYLYAD